MVAQLGDAVAKLRNVMGMWWIDREMWWISWEMLWIDWEM
jgi:hypothetical protein